MLSLPTITYFVIQNNKVQQYLVQKISVKLSALLGSSLTVEYASIDLFSNFHLKKVLFLDTKNDTLVYAPEVIIKPSSFTFFSQYIEIDKIILRKPVFNLNVDSAGTTNLQFIINRFTSKKKSTKSSGWVLSFREIELHEARFHMNLAKVAERKSGINFANLDLYPLNGNVEGMRTTGDGIEMKIKNFNAIERSGFCIRDFSGCLKINKNNMVFNDVELETPYSHINADQIAMNFSKWKDFGLSTLYKEVKFNLELNESVLSATDLAYFATVFKKYDLAIQIKGKASGPISNIKAKNIEIEYGKRTFLKGDCTISGLPDMANTFLHISIKNFTSNPEDVESIYLPSLKNKHIILPSNFKQVSFIHYKGKFTGFISDFVAYGTIDTNLGSVESDLSVRPDTARSFVFNGKVKLKEFQLGTFLSKQEILGTTNLNVLANGKVSNGKDFVINVDGQIYSLIFKKYNYQNIKVDGSVTNKTFDGKLSVLDPNIDLTFNGNVNFLDTVPVFKFIANVKHANLFKLHLDEKDSSSTASFYATADFAGNNIDNIKGEIKLWNSSFTKTGKQIQINDFLLFTQTVNDTNFLILRSSLADAEIWGTYRFNELISSFKSLARPYFPSLIKSPVADSVFYNNFKFEIDLKDTRQLTDFLVPEFYISTDSKVSGNYYPQNHELNFLVQVPLLQYKSRKWYNVYFNGSAVRDSFSLISGCKNLKITNDLNLENFTIYSSFKHDSAKIAVRWNNWDTLAYKGNFSISGHIGKKFNKAEAHFTVNPSSLVLKDTVWNIAAGKIALDSAGILVNDFELVHNNQMVKASGKVSNQKDDHLVVEFINLDLGHLKTIYTPKRLIVNGILNGKAQFSDLFTNPLVFASLTIDSLSINNQVVGFTKLNANWNSNDKSIFLNTNSFRGNLQTLSAKGRYFIETKDLDFDISLNKLKLDIFEPFLSVIFSNVRGLASGNLKITGNTSNPLINGELKAQKAAFVVTYLKTRYNFSSTVMVKNNSFIFDNIEVFDRKNNKALLNGKIEFERLRKIYVDLKVDATNFECLNTTDKDNSIFYGTGYATGEVTIVGTSPNIELDVTATSNRNTAIFIPLLSKGDISESKFIRMVHESPTRVDPYAKYEIDKKEVIQEGVSLNPGLKLNINLNVTPDAEVQIVFDEKIGDLIQGTGNGNLNIFLDGGRFSMFGKYTIDKGEYLFTLQNIINKKFEIKRGGTIIWNGDPVDATVKLEALYRVKAPLYGLIPGAEDRYKKRIPIDCRLWITDKLMNPNIRYDIFLPNSDPDTRNLVDNAINNDAERSTQFLSLLILNSFMPVSNTGTAGNNAQESPSGISAAGVTGIEFMSNQLSHWLSQISKDFDIGINYHTGDEITNQEVEVALSTQLLNDRVMINGNVDVGVEKQNQKTLNKNNNIVGDFNIEYKFTDEGKVRMKVFNRSNDSYFDQFSSPYTQGVGLFYKEDFNTFPELFSTYYRTFFTRKNKEAQIKKDTVAKVTPSPFVNDSISKETVVPFFEKKDSIK